MDLPRKLRLDRLTVVDPEGPRSAWMAGVTFQNDGQFTDLCPGTYPVLMLNAAGCEAEASGTVGSPAPGPRGVHRQPGHGARFRSLWSRSTTSANAVLYSWDFAGLGSSTLAEPSFVFRTCSAAPTRSVSPFPT